MDWPTTWELVRGGVVEPLLFATVAAAVLNLYIVAVRRRSLLRRILGLGSPSLSMHPLGVRMSKIAVTYGLVSPEVADVPFYMVEEGDSIALFTVITLLSELYGRARIEVRNHLDIQAELHDKQDIVSVSGPRCNSVTELYLGLIGSPVLPRRPTGRPREGYLMVNTGEGQECFYSEYSSSGRPTTCYGYIIRSVTTSGGGRQGVVLLAGLSNLSTYAAALVLSAVSRNTSLRSQVRSYKLWRQRSWALVFRVENWIEGSRWHRATPPIKIGPLRFNIERVLTEDAFGEPFRYEEH